MARDLALLHAARDRLIARNADFLDLDPAIGQFALGLAGDRLRDSGVEDVLNTEDYVALVETVAVAIATGMHVALEEALKEGDDMASPAQPGLVSATCPRCGAGVIREGLEHQDERQVLLDPRAITVFGLVVHGDGALERAAPIFVYPEHRCGDLDEFARLAALTQAQLDELVHDRKGAEAAVINNGGKVEQLGYLTGACPDVVARFLEARGRPGAGD